MNSSKHDPSSAWGEVAANVAAARAAGYRWGAVCVAGGRREARRRRLFASASAVPAVLRWLMECCVRSRRGRMTTAGRATERGRDTIVGRAEAKRMMAQAHNINNFRAHSMSARAHDDLVRAVKAETLIPLRLRPRRMLLVGDP